MQQYVDDIRTKGLDEKWAAVEALSLAGADVVQPLLQVVADGDPASKKAASEALRKVVNHSTRPGAENEAEAVADELAVMTSSRHSREVRVKAIWHLGFVGNAKHAGVLADLMLDRDVREDARMALERIPGEDVTGIIRNSVDRVPADFRPAVEQSLATRQVTGRLLGIGARRE